MQKKNLTVSPPFSKFFVLVCLCLPPTVMSLDKEFTKKDTKKYLKKLGLN